MGLIFFYNRVMCFRRLACDEVALVGEDRTEELTAGTVVGTYFQAKSAFQTLGYGVLMCLLLWIACGDLLQIGLRPVQLFVNDAAIHDQICHHGEFAQWLKNQGVALEVIHEGSAGKGGNAVDHHRAAAAHRLHTAAFPADPGGGVSVGIKQIICIIQRI